MSDIINEIRELRVKAEKFDNLNEVYEKKFEEAKELVGKLGELLNVKNSRGPYKTRERSGITAEECADKAIKILLETKTQHLLVDLEAQMGRTVTGAFQQKFRNILRATKNIRVERIPGSRQTVAYYKEPMPHADIRVKDVVKNIKTGDNL